MRSTLIAATLNVTTAMPIIAKELQFLIDNDKPEECGHRRP